MSSGDSLYDSHDYDILIDVSTLNIEMETGAVSTFNTSDWALLHHASEETLAFSFQHMQKSMIMPIEGRRQDAFSAHFRAFIPSLPSKTNLWDIFCCLRWYLNHNKWKSAVSRNCGRKAKQPS